jgi:ferredoxin
MNLIREIDRGTPASAAAESVTLSIDGASVTVPAGTSIMRAASLAGTDIPKLCATDSMKAFGSCRICLVEIDGRPGTPASCTTPVAEGMVVRTASERIDRLRKGVMELYLSDHPVPELATEMREMAEMIGVAKSRYLPVAKHLGAEIDSSNPYFDLRSGQVHNLLALRPRLRRGPGHVRADHLRPRLRQPRLGEPGAALPPVRMRLLRRLRPGLPDRLAAGESGQGGRPARMVGNHHLRLLRRRLHLQGGDEGRAGRPHDPLEGRQGQSRP